MVIRKASKIPLARQSDKWIIRPEAFAEGSQKSLGTWTTVVQPHQVRFPTARLDVRSMNLVAERTFWEKACLLHEETFRSADKPRKLRMARHYYDLWCLLRAGIGETALADKILFRRVVEHRELFFRYSWVDYSTHKPGTFRLSPPVHQLADWRTDYN